MTSEYTPREEFANVRRIGQFDEPNPEAYLGAGALREEAIGNHPAKGKRVRKEKERAKLDPEELVNLVRLTMLMFGAICVGVGIGLWIAPAVGLAVFGALVWVMGAWFIGTSKIAEDGN